MKKKIELYDKLARRLEIKLPPNSVDPDHPHFLLNLKLGRTKWSGIVFKKNPDTSYLTTIIKAVIDKELEKAQNLHTNKTKDVIFYVANCKSWQDIEYLGRTKVLLELGTKYAKKK